MTADTMTQNEIDNLTNEIRTTITAMRKAKLLTRNAIMSHIGKNNAILRSSSIQLQEYGLDVGSTRETRKLLIWNEYLKMELENMTGIPSDMRKSSALTAKATTTTRIKNDNNAAAAMFLAGKR